MLPFDLADPSHTEIQSRFQRAMRNGNIRWLWPNISVEAWQAALHQIEIVTRQVLMEGSASVELRAPAEVLSVAAYTSGMGPLLGYWSARGLFSAPADVRAVLELHLRHNSIRMTALATRTIEALGCLERYGVRAIVLKGMQTAFSCFPEPGTRSLTDIDLLIRSADKQAAGEALHVLGYRPGKVSPVPPQQDWRMPDTSALPRNLLFTHRDDPWSIDLQTSLSRRYSPGSKMIELDALCAAECLEPATLSPSADTLAPTALVLHLSCHASCGLENLTMLRLVEIVLAVRKSSEAARFSWRDFLDLAKRTRTLSSAYPALCLTDAICPGTVPASVMDAGRAIAPQAVQRVVGKLRPANSQRVVRCSLEERFMWANTVPRVLCQIVLELVPVSARPADLWWFYKARVWRLLGRAFTLAAAEIS